MNLLPVLLVSLMLPALIWAQSGVNARNQGGDSSRVSDGPGYVEIPPDIPPENYFSLTYHPTTPQEGISGWYDVRDGDGFARDFKREFTVTFQEVEMSFPVFFYVDRKKPLPPFPSPQFSVNGATELDSRLGRSPSLPYRAFYISEPISTATELYVIDHLKSYSRPRGDTGLVSTYYRWSLGRVSPVEPIAITSSLLFKLPEAAILENEEYGVLVPFSTGGGYLSSINPETDRPIYHSRLRAVYLHKPEHLKTRLSWQPTASLQVWHTPFKARSDGDSYFANGFIPEGKEFVHKDDTNPVFLEATSKDPTLLKWGLGGKFHTVQVIPVDMAVDANRDGTIKFAGNLSEAIAEFDATSPEKPFRFWLNNDNDNEYEVEEVPPSHPDHHDNLISSQRDLEDFVRLQLYFGGLHEAIASGAIRVRLEWKGFGGTRPGLRVFPQRDPAGSDDYLKSVAAAGQEEPNFGVGTIRHNSPATLSVSAFENLSAGNPKINFIFEGISEGKGELVVSFWKDGEKIGEGPGVWIELLDVKKMYQSSEGDQFIEPHDEEETSITFVHGWNMSPTGSRSYAETMFKRLWHRGYKGRFAYFRWNTYWLSAFDVVSTLTEQYFANYNNSEYIAWTQGAPALRAFVESLPYENKNIAAHSMGNIVVGEAMQLGLAVNNYALMQPAVPAACYDDGEDLKQTSTYQHSFIGVNFTMWDQQSPDDDPDEATRIMAYRGALKDIGPNGNLILFFQPNDRATSYAWELNNDITKPTGFLAGHFRYQRTNPSGEKLYKDYGGGLHDYFWSSRRESMTFACRTWGKAAGADGRTQGAIAEGNRVNLSDGQYQLPEAQTSGFGDQHSGQFDSSIQSLKPFYDTLINRLQVGPPNP